MELEILKGVESIGGCDIVVMDELRDKYPEKFNESGAMDYAWFEKEIRPNKFIYIRNDKNSISFTLQNGPIKENGVNGCQVDHLIRVAYQMVKKLDEKLPCKENKKCIGALSMAIGALEERAHERRKRGVEGTSKA